MKFGIDEIILWSNKNKVRRIYFKRNKINMISGKSGMGKTSIMKIIDYCFLASNHKITHSIINENIAWYGIKFYINNKEFIIARKSPNGEIVSKDFYFSNLNLNPTIPNANIDISDLKKIIDSEFSINNDTTLSHGGNYLKKDSKISFRYFMLFNTISEDIITNTNQFFDKQNQERYREALPRIFDLALQIDNVENILKRELKDSLQKKISKELQKGEIIKNKSSFFDLERNNVLKESLSLGINLENINEKFEYTKIFSEEDNKDYSNFSDNLMKLYSVQIKIKRLNRLKVDYSKYKDSLAKNLDSLLPIDLIFSNDETIISEDFLPIMEKLKKELLSIKLLIVDKQPLELEIKSNLIKLKDDEIKLKKQIENYPYEIKALKDFDQLITSVGRINAKNELFTDVENNETYNKSLVNNLQNQLDGIDILDVENERYHIRNLIDEIGNKMKSYIKDSLDNYSDWNFYFNYQEKITQLKMPASSITENVGSSSNHMFLHLLHFLTLHYVIILKKSPYVPGFLLIDQLSRPYYGTDKNAIEEDKFLIENNSDENKVYSALNLLNVFIDVINRRLKHEFQIILIEHIPKEYAIKYKNFHIVENFDSENPLIPPNWYK
ncbi:DUF3732 domain-containing protein [Acinetobacter guillouiae]|uniref:DUF3732 domain-containing protein n=1 Tax=Acinetobacter guillouiae TaxID=106649 RepID=UPI0028D2333E|nr:DUF3732 domain-containing protein [Acinetobacter guillouiae]